MNTITKGKITKTKKQTGKFAADNIDNTAPVQKVLEDLQLKNIPAYALYCCTLRQRSSLKIHRSFHYTHTGHPLYAFADDWEGDLNSGYFERFTYKSLMPKIITPLDNIHETDPVINVMKIKKEWLRETRVFHKIASM